MVWQDQERIERERRARRRHINEGLRLAAYIIASALGLALLVWTVSQ